VARRHIVLVGLSGAGKTAAGRRAAELLGAPFVDIDALIEARAGKSIAHIFAEDGERTFRFLEAGVGKEVLAGAPAVVATGGGFFEDAAVRWRCLESACVIYLQTDPGTAAARLVGAADRPLLRGAEPEGRLRELLALREPAYLQAQKRVRTDALRLDEVAERIYELARAEGGW
jgi:shikimate kinase